MRSRFWASLARTLLAFNYVVDANGTYWGIQDAASPGVDTGSIRATQIAPGDNQPFSTQINGFGGIKVLVRRDVAALQRRIDARLRLDLRRRRSLHDDAAVDLGGVTISRSVYVKRSGTRGAGSTASPIPRQKTLRIAVAFGGQSGIGTAGPNKSTNVVNTSSGDAVVTPEDSWVEVATPPAGTTPVGGPHVTAIGTPTTPPTPSAGP